jgi:predicted pyridoxine 5'-phosphate oxidase superfamily flavin-nucleotide-binding protein
MTRLDAATTAIVRSADTFFVATHAAADLRSGGSDVSHRGGRPGFVRVDDNGGTITWPDFSGNRYFNTLGNMALDARSGLVFADFTNGDLLHVTGLADIVWEADELRAFQGAERLVRLQVHEVVFRPRAWPLRWRLIENSPSLQGTGTW